MAISVMHGDERMNEGVLRSDTPSEALGQLEAILAPFHDGEQLFITARTSTSRLSMWRTHSKATALYWCASALAKLWRPAEGAASDPGLTGPHLGRHAPSV